MDAITMNYLMYVVLPLWIVCGFLDSLCHRGTSIAQTSGTKESLIHSLMLAEVGAPILLALLAEINGGVIALMILAFLLHTVTAVWDVVYAEQWRVISHTENIIHNFLMVLPFMAVSFIICLHWSAFLSLLGLGPDRLDLRLAWKANGLPPTYVAVIIAAVLLFLALPYAIELFTRLRASHGARRVRSAHHTPPGAVHPAF